MYFQGCNSATRKCCSGRNDSSFVLKADTLAIISAVERDLVAGGAWVHAMTTLGPVGHDSMRDAQQPNQHPALVTILVDTQYAADVKLDIIVDLAKMVAISHAAHPVLGRLLVPCAEVAMGRLWQAGACDLVNGVEDLAGAGVFAHCRPQGLPLCHFQNMIILTGLQPWINH